uniref:Uncharacterized protein n=1 Tax=Panagrolaimus sp. ES5 TaxID=591445 RepID=A0AC34FKZ1_9BILA
MKLFFNNNNVFGSPELAIENPITTPPEPSQFSPPPLTPYPSQISQAVGPKSVRFDISRDDPRTIPELKALSDENLWSNHSNFHEC